MNKEASDMSEPSREEAEQPDLLQQVHLSTEEGVYGLILVAGLIAVAGSTGQGPVQTLAFIAITVGVFWAAHVYAGTVAAHSGNAAAHVSLGVAFRHSLTRSRGLLTAVIPPAIPLVLSALGVFEARTADWLALWAIVGVLAILGYLAYSRKGAAIHVRLIGAASTAAFGIVIILAKAMLHH